MGEAPRPRRRRPERDFPLRLRRTECAPWDLCRLLVGPGQCWVHPLVWNLQRKLKPFLPVKAFVGDPDFASTGMDQ